MVAARAEFLGAGHYDMISAALAAAVTTSAASAMVATGNGSTAGPADGAYPRLVVDAGAGTGRHLAAVLDATPDAVGLALDVSKPALRRAARAHPAGGRGALRHLGSPAAGRRVDRAAAQRLRPAQRAGVPPGAPPGRRPAGGHAGRRPPHRTGRTARPAPGRPGQGATGSRAAWPGSSTWSARPAHPPDAAAPARRWRPWSGMGPSAWHVDPDRLAARIDALPEPVTVTAAVDLGVYRPR